MNVFRLLAELEDDSYLHTARLLVLMREFAGKKGTGKINGLTKLVKLDFLLRYPVYLERALQKTGAKKEDVETAEYERKSVESKMIRFHYGPWDPRYHAFINLLVGRGLCEVNVSGRTICIGLTEKGYETASKLSQVEEFVKFANRAQILKKHFDMSGSNLKEFIYETFPEIVSLKLGEVIEYEYEV
jgi:hypothetical protein